MTRGDGLAVPRGHGLAVPRGRRLALVAGLLLLAVALLVWPLAGDALAQDGTDGGGFGSQGDVTDRYGIPVWDYQVDGLRARGPDVGQASNTVPLGISSMLFWFAKFLVVALVWLLKFALDFGVASTLLGPVEELINVYQTFVNQLGLVPLALTLCVFWFGLVALRGRMGKGFSEILLSFVLVALLTAILAAPGATLLGDQGLLGRSRDIGSTVAVLAVQDPSVALQAPGCRQVTPVDEPLIDGCLPDELGEGVPAADDPHVLRWILQTWLVDLYIRQPHQYIVYGQRLDCPLTLNVRRSGPGSSTEDDPCRPHPCVGRYNEILRTRPADLEGQGSPSADPNSYMYDMMHPEAGGYEHPPECGEAGRELAAYNNSGDWGRVGMAVFLVGALALLAVFLAAGVLLPLIVGQVLIAILAVALVFVLPVALLGGGGRQALWKWFGLLLAALLMIVVSLVGLSLMLITTDLLLRNNWHLSISLLMVCVSSVVFLLIQRGLLRGGMSGGVAAGGALGRLQIGGSGGGGGGDPPGWSRTASAGLDPVIRTTTLAPMRENMQERRQLVRRLHNEDVVQARHPEFLRHDMTRRRAAEHRWQKKHKT